MDSSTTSSHHLHQKQCDGKRPSSRRIPSFSSSSSSSSAAASASSSSSLDDSLLGPATPLRLISRIPFSWEHFPGIPKNQNCKINKKIIGSSPSHKLLPLPPPTTTQHLEHHHQIRNSTRKKHLIQGRFQRDPFFAALVECSKSKKDYDHHQEEAAATDSLWNSNNNNNNVAKVSRSLTDRFEFISLFASCKRTCTVSESLVHLPSSRRAS